ncbi:MAG: magnesium transporter MgtC [Acidobacteria bacterium]|nr:MAG: magnesium transporter MgtC [Acidobacteriota bacterium]
METFFNQQWPAIQIVVKLLMAMLCGGAIGFERELSRKAAGLRTNVLICMGAALYMIVSRHISGGAPYTDPARLVAQVVAGIGFLGAGVILQARGSVHGLTTAATIFVVGAIGISIGEGLFGLATLSTILIIVVLVLLRRLEDEVLRRKRLFHYTVKTKDPAEFLERLLDTLEQERLRLEDFDVREIEDNLHEVRLGCIASVGGNRRLLKRLSELGKDLRSSTGERPE